MPMNLKKQGIELKKRPIKIYFFYNKDSIDLWVFPSRIGIFSKNMSKFSKDLCLFPAKIQRYIECSLNLVRFCPLHSTVLSALENKLELTVNNTKE